ncbi:MAG: alpha-ketoglutarate-dependent dioxygenase AlkB, partial [Streptosporangiaceae bacterium]
MPALFPQPTLEVAPGAVHIPGWLTIAEQRKLVAACRIWARPPAGMRATRMPTGGVMSVQTVCLGWHWLPYRYSRTADDVDGAEGKPFPGWLGDLGRRAVAAVYGDAAAASEYGPDVALINYYDDAARMGMHADKDERSPAPVVSLSIGTTCVFRFGNAAGRGRPWTD